MNKAELSSAVAQRMEGDITKKAAAEAVNAVFEVIAETLSDGEKIAISGFGSFEPRMRKARTAKSPVTGESIEVPETMAPAFRASKLLKNQVAGKTE